MEDDYGASVYDWVSVVRRARLGKTVKYVAAALATYADPDGTRIFPGIALIAIEWELSYNTVKDAMAILRDYELVELVRKSTTRGQSDEYRLTLGARVMDKVDVPTPAAIKLMAERLRESRRGQYRPVTPPDLRPTGRAADPVDKGPESPVDNSDLRHAAQAADEKPAARPTDAETGPAARPTDDLRHAPRPPTNHYLDTRTTNHETADVNTAVTVPSARAAEEPIFDSGKSTPPRGRHAAPDDEPDTAGNVIPFPKAKAS